MCENDEIEVKVWNRLRNSEGTSIHWHGIHQRDTPYMDGGTMITQCPISAQSSFTYNFKVIVKIMTLAIAFNRLWDVKRSAIYMVCPLEL